MSNNATPQRDTTTSPLGHTLPEQRPEWIRLPKTGSRCQFTGLSRASLNELILPPNVRVESVVLRQVGATRGIRLIRLSSLLRFLDAEQMRQQQEKNA